MKKYIISVSAGFLVLTLAYIISGFILNNNDNEEKLVSDSAKLVSVIKVKNSLNSIQLSVDGRLKSKNRIKLYSEVQGLINFNQNIFAEGNSFLKKELIISINSNEFHSSVKQARSELQNLVASILPDIKIDFSNNFNQWESYFINFDINKSVSDLPVTKSEKEKYYIVGKGVQSTYYRVKSLEERLKKYEIFAPFDGSLINLNVTEGTMVNPGMLLGSFISDDNFELSVNIPSKYAQYIITNESVSIKSEGKEYFGKVKRINKNIDELSQTVGIHIEFENQNLKDGMYIKTKIPLNLKSEGFSISRSNLINDKFVFVVEDDNFVGIRNVEIIYYGEDSAIVSGLEDNTKLIATYIPGIYEGMKIKISN